MPLKMTIVSGLFDGFKPAIIVNLQTGERIPVSMCKRWEGDHSCWDTSDSNGQRRIFKGNGQHAFSDQFAIVNYFVEEDHEPA
jgi:hypothetical protein